MRHLLPLLLLLPLSALAQVGPPCTPQLVITYDAAGNRIQRKEVCDPGGAGTNSSSSEAFRTAGPGASAPLGGQDSLAFSVSPNPGAVFLIQRSGGAEGQALLEVFTPDGRLIRTDVFEGQAHKLDLRALPDGLYLLRLRSGERVWEKKLVKRG
ncbi:MAG: T9SS type A sorting domain-containing protein [Bacteroidia bacterium]|nr:T9SS type A sorting domain-containing protein [Bacteroidia bacterium]